MLSIDFPGANITFEKPDSMTDEQCTPMRGLKAVTQEGWPLIETRWQPNKEDIDAINAGRPIIIHLVTPIMPPIQVFTIDENGESNS